MGKEVVLSRSCGWWSRTGERGLRKCDCKMCFRIEVLGEKNGFELDFLVFLVVRMYCLMGLELVLLCMTGGEQVCGLESDW